MVIVNYFYVKKKKKNNVFCIHIHKKNIGKSIYHM